jgi:hypothetical protein
VKVDGLTIGPSGIKVFGMAICALTIMHPCTRPFCGVVVCAGGLVKGRI